MGRDSTIPWTDGIGFERDVLVSKCSQLEHSLRYDVGKFKRSILSASSVEFERTGHVVLNPNDEPLIKIVGKLLPGQGHVLWKTIAGASSKLGFRLRSR